MTDQPDDTTATGTNVDRSMGEAARLHEPAPVSRDTEHDRLAAVRPDLADRLARLEAAMRAEAASSTGAGPYAYSPPLHEHVHISWNPGGNIGGESVRITDPGGP